MVLFSTYRNSKLLGQGSFKNLVNIHRGIGENWTGRPWGSGSFFVPGAFQYSSFFMSWLMITYFTRKMYMSKEWDNDEYERTLLKRHGVNPETGKEDIEYLRKTMSPEDQARARGFYFFERQHSVFMPAKWKFAPNGSDFAQNTHH